MRVLVTGASGQVGGAVAARFVAAGAEVYGLSRRLPAAIPAANHVQCDLRSAGTADFVARQTERCDIVVHAAASLDKDLFANDMVLANCLGTQEILKLAARWNSFFAYVSGVAVIGRPRTLPITEDHPTDPATAYHAAKLFGEHLTMVAGRAGLAAAVLRLTAPVGPGTPHDRILSVFVTRALSNQPIELSGRGTRQQDYVDVRDAAIAVEQCASTRAVGLFNVGSGRSISNRELAGTCVSLLGSASSIGVNGRADPEDDVIWDVSIARARQAFGYSPAYSLEDSIRAVAHRRRD